jgi:hypothetical protein
MYGKSLSATLVMNFYKKKGFIWNRMVNQRRCSGVQMFSGRPTTRLQLTYHPPIFLEEMRRKRKRKSPPSCKHTNSPLLIGLHIVHRCVGFKFIQQGSTY